MAGGEPAAIARGQGPVWAADSRSILYSNGEVGTNWSLWRVPFDPARGQTAGDPRALTVGRGFDRFEVLGSVNQSRTSRIEIFLNFDRNRSGFTGGKVVAPNVAGLLEDLGNGLGVTDPVSGSTVIETT